MGGDIPFAQTQHIHIVSIRKLTQENRFHTANDIEIYALE